MDSQKIKPVTPVPYYASFKLSPRRFMKSYALEDSMRVSQPSYKLPSQKALLS